MHSASNDHPLTMLIRKLESIAPLSNEEHRIILSLPTRTRTIPAGQDIFRDGDQILQCCLMLEGWACRYKFLDEGRRQILSFHIPGDVPDLQTLHLPAMDHSLGTLTQATVAFIPHENIRDFMLRFPEFRAALWRETLIDSAISREWMIGMGRRSAYGRIAHLLCEMYAKLKAVGLVSDHRYSLPNYAKRTRGCNGSLERAREPRVASLAQQGPDHPAQQYAHCSRLGCACPSLRIRSNLPASAKNGLKDEFSLPVCAYRAPVRKPQVLSLT